MSRAGTVNERIEAALTPLAGYSKESGPPNPPPPAVTVAMPRPSPPLGRPAFWVHSALLAVCSLSAWWGVEAAPGTDKTPDFTRDIPRSHVLTMRWIMRPPRPEEALDGPEVSPDMIIRDSIGPITSASGPARIVQDGQLLGVVDRDDLLTVIAGGQS